MLSDFKVRGIKNAKEVLDKNLRMVQKHHFKVKKDQTVYTEEPSLLVKIKTFFNKK